MAVIRDLSHEGDINITILQYLKQYSNPQIEIEHIKAKRNVSIEIDQYFHRSPDYMALLTRIRKAEEKLATITDHCSGDYQKSEEYLQDLYKLEESFKIDVLHLADIFLRINVKSERLTKAIQLFEEGHIKEADAILAEEDLIKDQNDLLIATDYWEHRKSDILGLLSSLQNNTDI